MALALGAVSASICGFGLGYGIAERRRRQSTPTSPSVSFSAVVDVQSPNLSPYGSVTELSLGPEAYVTQDSYSPRLAKSTWDEPANARAKGVDAALIAYLDSQTLASGSDGEEADLMARRKRSMRDVQSLPNMGSTASPPVVQTRRVTDDGFDAMLKTSNISRRRSFHFEPEFNESTEDVKKAEKNGKRSRSHDSHKVVKRPSADDIGKVSLEARRKVYGLGGYSQQNRVMLCMVGLPARGKSYISKMLTRYLQWQGFPVKVFNAGNLRRHMGMAGASADFFKSESAAKTRDELATATMEEAFNWLNAQDDLCVAIFDATNTTRKRRQQIVESCTKPGITPVFIESICDDEKILQQNYKMKLQNDDYKDMNAEKARSDFLERVKAYETRYESVQDDECAGAVRYVKLFNVGQKVVMKGCSGYLMSDIGFYLGNVHISPRKIWLMHHCETEECVMGQMGSVSCNITASGLRFCREVAKYIHTSVQTMKDAGEDESADVVQIIGTAPVHDATCKGLKKMSRGDGMLGEKAAKTVARFPLMSTSLLNELDGGDYDGMTQHELQTEHHELWEAREKDKLNFRYPGAGGESYYDVVKRLGPVIIELERQRRSVLVISHLAVQRCIYGYFKNTKMQDIPYLDMEGHTLYELTPGPFGTTVKRIRLTVPQQGREMSPPSHGSVCSVAAEQRRPSPGPPRRNCRRASYPSPGSDLEFIESLGSGGNDFQLRGLSRERQQKS